MDRRLMSQSFLGADSDAILASTTAGIVGVGGGGSHVVLQLAHLGVETFVVVDPDRIENKNLNRLVGGIVADVEAGCPKTSIAERVIRSVNPRAQVVACRSRWQESVEALRACDVIFGCVDSYGERDELERFARRFLVPYIDVGMDVHKAADGFSISGQVVLSSPGGPCLWCLGILNDSRLAQEAGQYGHAGPRPQVVWANGILASLGVGLFAQLVCPWHGSPLLTACCEFDGNRHRVEASRLDHAGEARCSHFTAADVGDVFYSRD